MGMSRICSFVDHVADLRIGTWEIRENLISLHRILILFSQDIRNSPSSSQDKPTDSNDKGSDKDNEQVSSE